ncbi:DUF3050 domain-containing protein [Spiribacter halobius]|uniref:Antimetabolite toxin biosynthesis protein MgoB n=1 Tax=Sediminicurvatus halobius TaxID=2182432 RepID=A0A2U2MX14_9GAMM|nr:DUF3050 domain-containing protein [Spiribacter halobius]PWG61397.1 hypothetical protein DEM34_16645 [Spiribacter halobius]UEX78544.1 DUF3050 domain-containing protein [Spiribacter halobius]
MFETLERRQAGLAHHPVFQLLRSPEAVRLFMQHHVFAVWDFMSLLKALQQRMTGCTLPWRPAPHPPRLIRLINELVLEEESGLDMGGRPMSHYELYLEAMSEVGADTRAVTRFVDDQDLRRLPPAVREFVDFHLTIATRGMDEEVAGALLFGRERVLPELFTALITGLGDRGARCPHFRYYLDRHVAREQHHHAARSRELLEYVVGEDPVRRQWCEDATLRSLELRHRLWDATAAAIIEARADIDRRESHGR